jgi:putative ABC transport system permease protein
MTLSKFVIRNITRRRGRFVFTLLGITIGIASFVAFLSLGGGLRREIHRETAALGANLIVTPKGSCAYEQVSILTGEQLPTTITMEEVEKIRAIKGLIAAPFLTEKTAIANRPVAVNGVIPGEMKRYKGWDVAEGVYLSGTEDKGAVIGAVLGRQFNVGQGQEITIRGERVPVRGVLRETGSRDDLTIFLSLPQAQRLFKTGEHVSFVAVRVDDLSRVEDYIERIKEAVSLGVVSDKQMLKSVLSIAGTVNITLQLIAAVAVLAAAFGIVNTMMTAAYERKREIGILQALGADRRMIFSAFLLESALYGLLGGVCGALAGVAFSTVAAPAIGQNAFTTFVKGSGTGGTLDAAMIGGSILFSVIVAAGAGLYPAWKAISYE